ncbi:Gfo/Idh/MocA family oxidoreductase [Prolixibacteraceae bacterium JC049]|nr:Gfo/Idh/MocA family oxidoreductase [Prolixibacteraceae bacterium JC049]
MSNSKKHNTINRRDFIKTSAKAGLAFSIIPSSSIAGLAQNPPSNKLNIAAIGVGGVGLTNLRNMESENIVAMCDVDWSYATTAVKRYPRAQRFSDFRKMLDERKDIDAVLVATPDHTHAVAALSAMRAGKHAFVQQPLTHSIYESRILSETARQYDLATQMGNQGASGDGVRSIMEWIWNGVIGEVEEVHVWTNRPLWKQPLETPIKSKRIPKDLNWDLFLGPTPFRDYHPTYTPWNWRAWWQFGNGALGEMGCHLLDPVFNALQLTHPEAVEANSTPFTVDSCPQAQQITWWFPRRDNLPKVGMPPVQVNWYDGGLMPKRPQELAPGTPMGKDPNGGILFVGNKGKIMCDAYGQNPTLLPEAKMRYFKAPAKQLVRVNDAFKGGHERDWIRACKESKDNRLPSSSDFAISGVVNETVLLGSIAVRLQSLNKRLFWDGNNMRFTNISPNEEVKLEQVRSFELTVGRPHFNQTFERFNALGAIEQWIRPIYRRGWDQI